MAVVPGLAGLAGTDSARDPAAFDAGFHRALLIVAGLLAAAGAVSSLLVRRPAAAPGSDRIPVERCHHCPLGAPPAHPADLAR